MTSAVTSVLATITVTKSLKKKRRSRRVLTLEERYGVVKALEIVRESGDGRLVEQVKGIAQRFNISNSHVYHLFAHRNAIKECVGEAQADSDEADEPNITPQNIRNSKRERRLPISLLTQIKIIEHAERHLLAKGKLSSKAIRRRFRVSAAEIAALYDRRAAVRKDFAHLTAKVGELCEAAPRMTVSNQLGGLQPRELEYGASRPAHPVLPLKLNVQEFTSETNLFIPSMNEILYHLVRDHDMN